MTRPLEATDPVEQLKTCDPLRKAALSSEGIEEALDDLGFALASLAPGEQRIRPAWRRHPARSVIAAAVLALAITGGIATAAGLFTAHTGQFPTKAEEAVGGPGEALDPAAPDFREVALQVASDIPYPQEYVSWRDFLISQEIRGDVSADGLVSTGALHGSFAASGFCAWVQAWRKADLTGDPQAVRDAAAMIAQAPAWKAVTDEDPHPDPNASNDPGAEQGTLFGWMLPYRDAVRASDRGRVERLLATGYGGGKCWLADPLWMGEVKQHDAWGQLSQSELARKYEQFLASERS